MKYKCTICRTEYKTAVLLKQHRNTAIHSESVERLSNPDQHQTKPCNFCGEEFQGIECLKLHMQTQHLRKSAICLYFYLKYSRLISIFIFSSRQTWQGLKNLNRFSTASITSLPRRFFSLNCLIRSRSRLFSKPILLKDIPPLFLLLIDISYFLNFILFIVPLFYNSRFFCRL